MIRRRTFAVFASLAFSLAGITGAFAQVDYPNKPVRLIVPFPPGGSADLVARSIAQRFLIETKQPMVVENRPGADTAIAMEVVKNAAPDGYTIGYAIGSAFDPDPIS